MTMVRHASTAELVDVMRVLEGALLEVDASDVEAAMERQEVLVADEEGQVVGALVRDGEHVEAIAVTPQRRRSGLGTLLVELALAETGRLTATFRPEVSEFYEYLGFDVEERADDLWGVATVADEPG